MQLNTIVQIFFSKQDPPHTQPTAHVQWVAAMASQPALPGVATPTKPQLGAISPKPSSCLPSCHLVLRPMPTWGGPVAPTSAPPATVHPPPCGPLRPGQGRAGTSSSLRQASTVRSNFSLSAHLGGHAARPGGWLMSGTEEARHMPQRRILRSPTSQPIKTISAPQPVRKGTSRRDFDVISLESLVS